MRKTETIAGAAAGLAVCLLLPFGAARSGTVTTIFAIPGYNDASHPGSKLTKLNGAYYGTTRLGGTNGAYPGQSYSGDGAIYRIDLKTGAETVVHAFGGAGDGVGPAGEMIALNGKLYGATGGGGANGGGTIFTYDPVSGTETVVYSLPSEVYPQSALTELNGVLYGTAQYCGSTYSVAGCIFSFDLESSAGQVVYGFPANRHDGASPGNLVAHGQYLYGTTYTGGGGGAGTLFRFDPATGKTTVEHAFGADGDGQYPAATLIDSGGVFYGTCSSGGASGFGVLFSFTPLMRQEAVLHSFAGPDGSRPSDGLVEQGGLIYGSTEYGGAPGDGNFTDYGVVFGFNPATASLSTVYAFDSADGDSGSNALMAVDGILYGAQYAGGPAGGIVYSLDPKSGSFSVLHDFAGAPPGGASGLTRIGSAFYGTAVGGGAGGFGSIYKVAPGSGAGTTLYSFDGLAGAYPRTGLLDVNGVLYGTANAGGAGNDGMVFSFTPTGRILTPLLNFAGKNGAAPSGPLTVLNGAAFGTTQRGGAHGQGTIFKIDLSNQAVTSLASLETGTGSDATGLIAANGMLYGTAAAGGAHGYGSIFEADPSSGTVTLLYSFAGGTDGANPTAPLFALNGVFYGTTDGSRRTQATVFAFDPATQTKTILHWLKKYTQLESALVMKGDKLYGTSPYAPDLGAPYGGILRISPAGGGTMVTAFSSGPSSDPVSALSLSQGALFGTTMTTTTANAGTVFKFVQ